jgi:hypothetical protein
VPEIYRRAVRLMAEELDCSQSFISVLADDGQTLQVETTYFKTADSTAITRWRLTSLTHDYSTLPKPLPTTNTGPAGRRPFNEREQSCF